MTLNKLDDFTYSNKLLQNRGSISGYYNKFQVFIFISDIILTESIANGEKVAESYKLSRINNIDAYWTKAIGTTEGACQLISINSDHNNWVVGWGGWPVNTQLFGTAIFVRK